jgi:hypothetical protein
MQGFPVVCEFMLVAFQRDLVGIVIGVYIRERCGWLKNLIS